jgi:hypothetical protein
MIIILGTSHNMAVPSDLRALPLFVSQATIQHYEKRDGRYFCQEEHPTIMQRLGACNKGFASKQALEAHRSRTVCEPFKLPSDQRVSRFFELTPEAAREVKHQGNQAAVSRYRKTIKGERATFRARHLAEYQKRALIAVPEREKPEVPEYMAPPISWLLAGAQLTWQEARSMLDGKLRMNHTTWSLRYHPDKVEVSDRTILEAT